MEKEVIQDLILRYGVLLGKRNTERQKTAFLRAAQKQLEQAGLSVDITCVSASVMRRETMNMYNLYAGDFKKADVVFITYYDTPLWQLLPKEQKAFDANWSKGNFLLHTLLFLSCVAVIAALLYLLVIPSLQEHGFVSFWGVVLVLLCLCGFYGIRQMRGGIATGNTMVRNSSSLIALFALACELSEQEKQHAAFTLIDEGTRSEYGLRMLQEYIGKRHLQRVYLDSIGNAGILQGFAERHIQEELPEELAEHVEWHDLAEGKHAYGDILITSGAYDKHEVTLQVNESSAAQEHVLTAVTFLHRLYHYLQT